MTTTTSTRWEDMDRETRGRLMGHCRKVQRAKLANKVVCDGEGCGRARLPGQTVCRLCKRRVKLGIPIAAGNKVR